MTRRVSGTLLLGVRQVFSSLPVHFLAYLFLYLPFFCLLMFFLQGKREGTPDTSIRTESFFCLTLAPTISNVANPSVSLFSILSILLSPCFLPPWFPTSLSSIFSSSYPFLLIYFFFLSSSFALLPLEIRQA